MGFDMDIRSVISKLDQITESVMLVEYLGNLSQLNLGPLIDVAKDDTDRPGTSGKDPNRLGTGIGPKFINSYNRIGSGSEIIDAGTLKGGIVGLRKAYKKVGDNVAAFALYIDNTAVVFGLFTSDKMSRPTEVGKIAYDFSKFPDQHGSMAAKDKEANKKSWGYKSPYANPDTKSKTEYDRYNYDSHEYEKFEVNHAGRQMPISELKLFLDKVEEIAANVGSPLNLKLVLSDTKGRDKSRNRVASRNYKDPLNGGLEALTARLRAYKNSKQPTAQNLKEFLSLVMNKAIKKIQYKGKTYSAIPEAEVINPLDMFNGKPFSIKYRNVDTEFSYGGLMVTYFYNNDTKTIEPTHARTTYSGLDDIIDFNQWAKSKFGSTEKDNIIRRLLGLMKNSKFDDVTNLINAMTGFGITWPEFGIIMKSIDAGKKKESE